MSIVTSSSALPLQASDGGQAALQHDGQLGFDEIGRSFALLVRLAMRYMPRSTRDKQSAEDIVQEALLRIWQQGIAESQPEPLAIRLRREVIALCRIGRSEEQSRYVHCLAELEETDACVSWTQIGQAAVQEEQSPRALVVAQLPAHHRDLLEMHYLERMSIRDMAALLGWSQRAVRRRVRNAVVYLKRRLGEAQLVEESLFSGTPSAAISAS